MRDPYRLPLLVEPEPWTRRGLCRHMDDLDAFFPHPKHQATALEAKAVCADRPVQFQCLHHALNNNERWGIWGGTTAADRARLRGDTPTLTGRATKTIRCHICHNPFRSNTHNARYCSTDCKRAADRTRKEGDAT